MNKRIITFKLWWRKTSPRIAAAPGRIPVTLIIFAALLIVGTFVENRVGDLAWAGIVQKYGWDLSTLQQGRIYAAWLGLFFSAEVEDFLGILLLLLLTVGALEYRAGPPLAVFAFFVVGPVASIITLLVLWPAGHVGIELIRVSLYTPDVGASTACLACLGIFFMLEKGRWRNILLYGVLAALVGLLFQHQVYSIDHLSGYLNGIWTGAVIAWWKKSRKKKAAGERPA